VGGLEWIAVSLEAGGFEGGAPWGEWGCRVCWGWDDGRSLLVCVVGFFVVVCFLCCCFC